MAQLQPQIHIRHLLRDLHNESPAHAALFKCNNPITQKSLFIDDFQCTVDLSNVHQHGPSCFKKKTGKRCCRFGRPAPLRNQTGQEQIVSLKANNNKPDISFDVLKTILSPTVTTTTHREYSRIPVAARDSRMIMYYLRRPAILQIRSDHFVENNPLVARLILSKEMQQEFNDLPTSDQKTQQSPSGKKRT